MKDGDNVKIFKPLFLFFIISISVLGSTSDAAKNVMDFSGIILENQYELRDLKSLSDKEKTPIVYLDKNYFLYSGTGGTNSEFTIQTKLYIGWDYIIIGAGDNDVSDIDIFIYDDAGNLVAVDRNKTKHSFPLFKSEYMDTTVTLNNNKNIEGQKISVRPIRSSSYTIKVKIRNAKTKDSGWAMLIASKRTPK